MTLPPIPLDDWRLTGKVLGDADGDRIKESITVIDLAPRVHQDAARWFEETAEALEGYAGARGDVLDRVVTLRDLYEAGATINLFGQILATNPTSPALTFTVPGALPPAETDTTQIGAPTGLAATNTHTRIILTWDVPALARYSHSEVMRAPSNNFSLAVPVGAGDSGYFVDVVGETSATFFYWIVHVNRNKVTRSQPGGENGTQNGLQASTSVFSGVDMADHIIAAERLAAGQFDLAGTKFAGQVVDDAQFAALAIGNAAIDGVVADEVTIGDGTIGAVHVDTLTVGGATGVEILDGAVRGLDIDVAQIDDTMIDRLSANRFLVQSIDIEDAAIKKANFQHLSVGAIKVQDLAVVSGQSASSLTGPVSVFLTTRLNTSGLGPLTYPVVVYVSRTANTASFLPITLTLNVYRLSGGVRAQTVLTLQSGGYSIGGLAATRYDGTLYRHSRFLNNQLSEHTPAPSFPPPFDFNEFDTSGVLGFMTYSLDAAWTIQEELLPQTDYEIELSASAYGSGFLLFLNTLEVAR